MDDVKNCEMVRHSETAGIYQIKTCDNNKADHKLMLLSRFYLKRQISG
jgi:hypothetical protein